MPNFIRPTKTQRLPDIVTIEQAQALFSATRTLSYKVFFFTLYSLGLRLGEGLALRVGDIDASRGRVHVRDAKGTRWRWSVALKKDHPAQLGVASLRVKLLALARDS